MAKFCTNCGDKLEDNAVCPKCNSVKKEKTVKDTKSDIKKEKKKMPIWLIILIIVILVVVIPITFLTVLFFNVFDYIDDNDIDIKDYVEKYLEKGTIGDTLRTDNFRIILTDTLMYSSIEAEEYTDMPSDGKEYLVFYFNIENISDDKEYISIHNFNGVVDGKSINPLKLVNSIDGVTNLDKDLYSGEKVRGFVAFEVDTNWKNFEIHFNENSWDEDDIVFEVVNENNDINITENQGA